MYKETVSPPRDVLLAILRQIPENKEKRTPARAIRSPYIWLGISQFAALSFLIALFVPMSFGQPTDVDYFRDIDIQVEQFEAGINDMDYERLLLN